MSKHLVLLGDSILDNAAYVPGGRPSVIDQVRARLPDGWRATLLARDGSVIDDVLRQLADLPGDASHLMLSAGGNDAILEVGILNQPAGKVGGALGQIAEVQDRFEAGYRRLIQAIQARGLPAVAGTIYNPCFPDPVLQRVTTAALCLFNDSILRTAHDFGLPVIDFRSICTSVRDYANEIEPSAGGGAKIAQAICRVILEHPFERRQTVVFP